MPPNQNKPSLVNTIIDMMRFSPVEPENQMYKGQEAVQKVK